MPTPTSEDVTQARAAGYREGLEAAIEVIETLEDTRGLRMRRDPLSAVLVALRALAAPAAAPAAEPEAP